MVLNVPRGRVHDLPDPLQVWPPISGSRRCVCSAGCNSGLTRGWYRQRNCGQQHACTDKYDDVLPHILRIVPVAALLYFFFFCSGLSGLIYQVVWVRVFGNVFGNTIYSASIVVAVFMLGLGVGSYVVGAWADGRYARLRSFELRRGSPEPSAKAARLRSFEPRRDEA